MTHTHGCVLWSSPSSDRRLRRVDQRASWTSLPEGDDFDFDHAVLSGVDHVIVTAKWGQWTERLLMLAQQSNIPCSLVGEAPPTGKRFSWYAVDVDETQSRQVNEDDCRIRVVTRGRDGATGSWSERTIYGAA